MTKYSYNILTLFLIIQFNYMVMIFVAKENLNDINVCTDQTNKQFKLI